MIILGVDTATKNCSVAIVDNNRILYENNCDNGKTHSINLMDMIVDLFDKSKLTIKDLNGFAVSIGPGSFTGLRIGISSVKGMAYATNKHIVGVNSLDALAFPLRHLKIPVVSVIDARREEIYYACYNFVNNKINFNISYKVASPEKAVFDIPDNSIVVGSGSSLSSIIAKRKLKAVKIMEKDNYNKINASSVAFIGAEKLSIGQSDKLSSLVPYYIRKPDAQINRDTLNF